MQELLTCSDLIKDCSHESRVLKPKDPKQTNSHCDSTKQFPMSNGRTVAEKREIRLEKNKQIASVPTIHLTCIRKFIGLLIAAPLLSICI